MLGNMVAGEVRGHDEDGLLALSRLALTVCQPALRGRRRMELRGEERGEGERVIELEGGRGERKDGRVGGEREVKEMRGKKR